MRNNQQWDFLNLDRYLAFIQNIVDTRGYFNPPETYYEVHHIKLRSFGGLPQKITHQSRTENLIWLTLSEHYEAHQILAEDNLDNYKVVFAFMHMSTRFDGETIKDKEEYKKIRARFIEHDRQINLGKASPNKGKHFDNAFKQKVSERTRAALADPKIREKISLAQKDRIPWNKGKVLSDDYKKKLSLAKKGKKLSPEHRQNIAKGNLGRIVTEETKQKIKDSQSGENCNRNRPIICLETGKIYFNIKSAAKELNCNAGNLVQVCKGRRKTEKGLHFKYIENNEN